MRIDGLKLSPEDVHLAEPHTWHVGSRGYARREVVADGRRTIVYLHRLVAGAMGGMVVDHINGDRLDNRRENLRVCKRADNAKNRKTHKNNSTGAKGVYPIGGGARFCAEIKSNKVKYRLGTFKTVDAAKAAYDAAAERLHGNFRRAE